MDWKCNEIDFRDVEPLCGLGSSDVLATGEDRSCGYFYVVPCPSPGIGEAGGRHTIRSVSGYEHWCGSGGMAGNAVGMLQVGMVQSIARRSYSVDPSLVIIDEAHHARAKTWEKVLATWPNAAKLIGLTATPQRLDGKGLGEHFAEMVLGPNIPDLVEQGYLAPCRILTLPSHFQREKMRQDRNGELRRQDVDEQVTDAVIADAVNAYTTYAMGKRAIFFGVHTDHSKKVCAGLRERGVRAEHVDGTDPTARRDRIMNELRTGGLDVVGNCDLISEGFDAPACEVIIMGSPTQSVTRYLQQAGRAMRPGIGKTALILDCAGNAHELGCRMKCASGRWMTGKSTRIRPRKSIPEFA